MKKIEYAVGAAGLFARHLHTEGFDHGMIATFGNTFQVEQGFTGTEALIHRSLAGIVAKVRANEGTRLYSSIEDAITQFWGTADRSRPWLLTIITDGQDNDKFGDYYQNPARLGRLIAQRYNHEPSNFIAIVGVGEGNEIDKRALATLGDTGGFTAMTIEAFPLLEYAFLMIAIQVTEQLVGRRLDIGNASWAEIAQIRQVNHVPIDYAFLIDRSGSMDQQG